MKETYATLLRGLYGNESVRKSRQKQLTPLFIGMLAVVFATRAMPAEIIDLGAAPAGYAFSGGAMNDLGQAFLNVSGPNSETLLYSNGQTTNIGNLGGGNASASSINDSGEIVGGSNGLPFAYYDGTMHAIGPNGYSGFAVSVNNKGLIVGQDSLERTFLAKPQTGVLFRIASPPDEPPYVYTLNGGPAGINNSGTIIYNQFSYIAPYGDFYTGTVSTKGGWQYLPAPLIPYPPEGPNEIITLAVAINSSGAIAYLTADGADELTVSFIMDRNGQLVQILTPTTGNTVVSAMNDSEEAVGTYDLNSSGVQFLYSRGNVIDINSLLPASSGWTITQADAINNADQIFGFGMFDGQEHAFILDTATPEPASTGLLLLGGGAIAASIRRRARRRPAHVALKPPAPRAAPAGRRLG